MDSFGRYSNSSAELGSSTISDKYTKLICFINLRSVAFTMLHLVGLLFSSSMPSYTLEWVEQPETTLSTWPEDSIHISSKSKLMDLSQCLRPAVYSHLTLQTLQWVQAHCLGSLATDGDWANRLKVEISHIQEIRITHLLFWLQMAWWQVLLFFSFC